MSLGAASVATNQKKDPVVVPPLVPAQAENGVEILAGKVGLGGNPLNRATLIRTLGFALEIQTTVALPTALLLTNVGNAAGLGGPYKIDPRSDPNPFPETQRNSVLQLGYNINQGNAGEGEMFIQFEGDFRPGGGLRFFELHVPEVLWLDGTRTRLLSFTANKVTKECVTYFRALDFQVANMAGTISFMTLNGSTAAFSILSTGTFSLAATDLAKLLTIQITAGNTVLNVDNPVLQIPGATLEATAYRSVVNAAFAPALLQTDGLAVASAGPARLYIMGNGGTVNYPAGIQTNGGAANTSEYMAVGINDTNTVGRVAGTQGGSILFDTRGGIDPVRVLVIDAANNARVGVSVSDVALVTFNNDVVVRHVLGKSVAPGIGGGAGLGGAGSAIVISGDDMSGYIELTIGAAPAVGATILATVTLTAAYPTQLNVILGPRDGVTALTYMPMGIYANVTSTSVFTIAVQASALIAGNIVKIYYHCAGK